MDLAIRHGDVDGLAVAHGVHVDLVMLHDEVDGHGVYRLRGFQQVRTKKSKINYSFNFKNQTFLLISRKNSGTKNLIYEIHKQYTPLQ